LSEWVYLAVHAAHEEYDALVAGLGGVGDADGVDGVVEAQLGELVDLDDVLEPLDDGLAKALAGVLVERPAEHLEEGHVGEQQRDDERKPVGLARAARHLEEEDALLPRRPLHAPEERRHVVGRAATEHDGSHDGQHRVHALPLEVRQLVVGQRRRVLHDSQHPLRALGLHAPRTRAQRPHCRRHQRHLLQLARVLCHQNHRQRQQARGVRHHDSHLFFLRTKIKTTDVSYLKCIIIKKKIKK